MPPDERAKWPCCKDGKHSMLRLIIALVIGLAANVNSVTVASAQTYPQRAVKFILPFGPAAGVDITARLLGDKLVGALGQAGGDREPSGRRRPRRHQRLHQRQRRPHAVVRPGLDLHGAPLCARKAALQRGARPAADRERHDHRDCALGSGIAEREIARRIHGAGPRQARYAQRGGRRRQFRPDPVGFHQDPGLAGGPGAVPRHPAGAERPGRSTASTC